MKIEPFLFVDKGFHPLFPLFLPFQGDRAAGWKTAGDESYAPRGPARPLQRTVGCAEADGPQLV